jgi:hypothetical protein
MVSEKAWYLVAAGVLALGVTNGYVSQGENWARVLAERSISILDGVSSQTMRLANLAETIVGRNDSNFAGVEASMARVQTHLACVQTTMARRQAEMARRQADFARSQAERARATAIEQLQHSFEVRPRRDFVVEPPRPPAIPTDDTI